MPQLEFERLPAVEAQVSYRTGHGTELASYTGALLWSVVDAEGIMPGDPRGAAITEGGPVPVHMINRIITYITATV